MGWEKEKLLESAAGVALSSGLIQVSVRAMRFSLEWLVMEVMKSALLTADWQFQRPIEKESSVLRPVHTKHDNDKDNYKDNDISVHTSER